MGDNTAMTTNFHRPAKAGSCLMRKAALLTCLLLGAFPTGAFAATTNITSTSDWSTNAPDIADTRTLKPGDWAIIAATPVLDNSSGTEKHLIINLGSQLAITSADNDSTHFSLTVKNLTLKGMLSGKGGNSTTGVMNTTGGEALRILGALDNTGTLTATGGDKTGIAADFASGGTGVALYGNAGGIVSTNQASGIIIAQGGKGFSTGADAPVNGGLGLGLYAGSLNNLGLITATGGGVGNGGFGMGGSGMSVSGSAFIEGELENRGTLNAIGAASSLATNSDLRTMSMTERGKLTTGQGRGGALGASVRHIEAQQRHRPHGYRGGELGRACRNRPQLRGGLQAGSIRRQHRGEAG